MLLISIFAIATVVALIVLLVFHLVGLDKTFITALALTLCLILTCVSGSLIGIEKRHECFIHKYENQKVLISKGTWAYASYVDCKEMNNKIARHKTYYDNKWIGIWFSEDIANLEPIALK